MASLVGLSVLCLAIAFSTVAAEDALERMKRVVGGDQYSEGEYQFSVSLWYLGDNNPYTNNTPGMDHTCGGSLLTDTWVLTAALCFDDNYLPGLSNLSLWTVAVGMYGQKDAETEAQLLEIDHVVMSPDYNLAELYGDVALLKLADPVDLSDPRVDIVPFNRDLSCPVDEQTCTVIGWGQEQQEPYGYGSEFPHEADVQIVSEADCKAAYQNDNISAIIGDVRIDDGILCAGVMGGGKDACYGDSGSPLLCQCRGRQVVAGIASYGFGCAMDGFPGVYSNVNYYRDFIKDTLAADP